MANSSPPRRATGVPAGSCVDQPLSEDHEQLVTDVVAEGVVDVLEPIEVEQEHGGAVIIVMAQTLPAIVR